MAEPYDTINSLGSQGGPKSWFRFNAASGGIPDEGQDPVVNGLSEVNDGGAFNGTYRFETDPSGLGFGLKLNGTGGLGQTVQTGDNTFNVASITNGQTVIVLLRKLAGSTQTQFQIGAFTGSDSQYVSYNVNTTGSANVKVQDAVSDDEVYFVTGDATFNDNLAHSWCHRTTSSDVLPKLYIDGVSQAVTHGGDDGVVGNYGIEDSFLPAVGFRGGVGSTRTTDMIYYEWLVFDESLSDADILTASQILIGIAPTDLTDAITALSPTHYWKFNEVSGLVAADSGSGTAVNLTHVNGPDLAVAGPTAEDVGIEYDGISEQSFGAISGAASIGTSNTGTWLFFVNYPAVNRNPFNLGRSANNDPTIGFNSTVGGFNQYQGVQSNNGSGNPNAGFTVNSDPLPSTEWLMLAFAHSGSVVTIFQDGANLDAGDVTLSTVGIGDGSEWLDDPGYAVMNRISFGVFDRVADLFFAASYSNVAYFDGTALTEEQLVTIYNIFKGITPPAGDGGNTAEITARNTAENTAR